MQLNPARGRKPGISRAIAEPTDSMVYAAQPREGTETLSTISTNFSASCIVRFMQLNPATGRKHTDSMRKKRLWRGLCSSTPRGDGNTYFDAKPRSGSTSWFMQLNPARGRKHIHQFVITAIYGKVYAAQPREGTETYHQSPFPAGRRRVRFMQLNPARGRKPCYSHRTTPKSHDSAYAAQPREGTETRTETLPILTWDASDEYGLCSSTPRGDGNDSPFPSFPTKKRFMQLNPARGRKREGRPYAKQPKKPGLCSSTPRGDGNIALFRSTLGGSRWRFMQLNPARGRKLGPGRPCRPQV